jgi:signal transduction histidine kinase
MSFATLNRIRKTLGVRLTSWYFGLFTLSTGVLFGTAYVLLGAILQSKDQEAVLLELQEFASEYQRGGLDAVEQEITLHQSHAGKVLFFVRVADPGNHTLLLSIPSQWNRFDLTQLENSDPSVDERWIQIPAKGEEEVLEVVSSRQPDETVLQVGINTEDREEVLEHFRDLLAAIMLPVIALGLGGGSFFAWRALRPVRDLIQALQSMLTTGRLTMRAPVTETGDELDELSTMFNSMLDRIAVLISGMQSALDNVAHDLRTPITRLRGTAELALQTEQSEATLRDALVNCLEESDRIHAMLNTLMDISEAEHGVMKLERKPLNVQDLVIQSIELYRDVAEDKAIQLSASVPPELSLHADRNRMLQSLTNLLDNAIKYTPPGGQVTMTATQGDHHLVLTITDTGIGIPAEDLPHIWDRLYRGDKSRSQRGLGLGLSFVKAIVQAHHGSVQVSSTPGGGSTFTLSLPLFFLQPS